MNTHSIKWHHDHPELSPLSRQLHAATRNVPAAARSLFNEATNHAIRAIAVTLAIMAILASGVWGSMLVGTNGITEAIIWTSGLIFLALAIESEPAQFYPLLFTGLSLPVMAVLAAKLSPIFVLFAAAVIATWAGTAILKAWND